MKKITALFLAVLFLFPSLSAGAEEPGADAPVLEFAANENGKYIYCNNPEWIRRENLADNSNPNPKFLMNNENLGPDQYTMFISLVNRTELPKANGTGFGTQGFDIEVDVLVRAKEDTELRLTSVGFEVPEQKKYYLNGNAYTAEEDLGCFTAWASYLKTPVSQLDSGKSYQPVSFHETTVTVEKGEAVWLSRFIPNYREVPFCRVVHMMADFEIVSGMADVNIAALRSTGVLSDRSNFVKDAAFGSYVRENQHKGIADAKNQVDANLNFVIDDSFTDGTKLPVTIVNQYAYEGNTVTNWFTNLNPRADPWNKYNAAESSLLKFRYEDPKKLSYYGKNVPASQQNNVWRFDSEHADTTQYPGRICGFTKNQYVPNFPLSGSVDESLCPNLGNYGVFQNYHITIDNQGKEDKYFLYKLNTMSNNLIILRDENGDVLQPYPVTKGATAVKESDCLACVKLPAGVSTKFTLTVVLTTNHYGGMENAFVISDTPSPVKTYDDSCLYNVKDTSFTGNETLKWADGNLLKTQDGRTFENTGMTETTKRQFHGRVGEMRFLYTPAGYVAKSCLYDGTPYYNVREFYRDVYLLDESFNIKLSHRFDSYATDMSYANGNFYVNAGTIFESEDFVTWNKSALTEMPVGNLGNLAAYMKNGRLFLSVCGEEFLQPEAVPPAYVDAIGNVFYCADGRDLFVSANCLSWKKYTFPEKINALGRHGNILTVNGAQEVDVSEVFSTTAVKLGDQLLELAVPMLVTEDETAYIPLRAFAEVVGAAVSWDADAGAAKVFYEKNEFVFSKHNFGGTMYLSETEAEEVLKKDVKVYSDAVIIE